MNNFGCTSCDQKAQTLGLLGWTPNGFGGLGDAALATPGLDQKVVLGVSLASLALHGFITWAGVHQFKKHHEVWGSVLLLFGVPGLVSGVITTVTSAKNVISPGA